jgi:drug/metabolite transporter (DMT)-like permease
VFIAVATHARGRVVSGILFALAAAFCYNLGLALQKKHAQDLPKVTGLSWVTVRTFLNEPGWLAGNGLALLGWICEFVALLRAPIGLVQPTMAAGVGFLAYLSVRWFRERLHVREWCGVAACSAGILLLALSVDPRRELLGRRLDGVALVGALGAVVFLSSVSCFMAKRASVHVEVGLGCAAGLLYSGTGLLTKALGITLFDRGEILVSLGVLAALLAISFSSLGILQAAYQRGRAIVVITLMGVLADFIPVILSLFVFHETWPRAGRGIIRLVAFAIIISGFLLLARPAARIEEIHPQPADLAQRAQKTA